MKIIDLKNILRLYDDSKEKFRSIIGNHPFIRKLKNVYIHALQRIANDQNLESELSDEEYLDIIKAYSAFDDHRPSAENTAYHSIHFHIETNSGCAGGQLFKELRN